MLDVRHTRIFVAVALPVVYSTQLCCFGISKKLSVYLLCSYLYVYLSNSYISIRRHYVRFIVRMLCDTQCERSPTRIKTKFGWCLCSPLSLCIYCDGGLWCPSMYPAKEQTSLVIGKLEAFDFDFKNLKISLGESYLT